MVAELANVTVPSEKGAKVKACREMRESVATSIKAGILATRAFK